MIFELVKLAPRGTAVLGPYKTFDKFVCPGWLLFSLTPYRSLWLGKKGGGEVPGVLEMVS